MPRDNILPFPVDYAEPARFVQSSDLYDDALRLIDQLEEDGHRYANAAAFAGLLVGLVIGAFLACGSLIFLRWMLGA